MNSVGPYPQTMHALLSASETLTSAICTDISDIICCYRQLVVRINRAVLLVVLHTRSSLFSASKTHEPAVVVLE